MDTYYGDGFQADITEWWDSSGEHHPYSPSEVELADAFEITVRYQYEDGSELHTTMFSGDTPETAMGWDYGEYEADILEYDDEGTP